MNSIVALQTIARLLGVFALLQSWEFLSLQKVTSDRGVWRWEDIRLELAGENKLLAKLFGIFLSPTGFYYLNMSRVAVGISLIFIPTGVGLAILLFLHVMTLLRWLGGFNGGSDYMNLLLLLFGSIGLFFPESMATVCLYYIAFQVCLSYFKAGWLKLENPHWRNGLALQEFLNSKTYEKNALLSRVTGSNRLSVLSSWLIILFEITFPLCLLDRRLAIAYMTLAFCFHLANAYVFALNRFVFAWLASYPAILFCAANIS